MSPRRTNLVTRSLGFAPSHFAVGDLVRWSGIKRCGAAMHMGYFAANNVHQLMRQEQGETEPPKFLQLDPIPPMIGLAVGKKAVSYWPGGGVTAGEDVMKLFFGDDLGFTSKPSIFYESWCWCALLMSVLVCWNHLGLGEEKAA